METSLSIKTFSLGAWMTNCYLLSTDDCEACCVIDAGFEPGELITSIKAMGKHCSVLILTHSHLDHIAGAAEMLAEWPDMEILIHESEAGFLNDPVKNLSVIAGMPVTAPPETGTLRHAQVLNVPGAELKVLHTPGHSPGCVCLYAADHGVLFAGDTLFHGSVGRYDFPGSDGDALFDSIRNHLLSLPDETRFFPGHGPGGTIGEERSTNPFLSAF